VIEKHGAKGEPRHLVEDWRRKEEPILLSPSSFQNHKGEKKKLRAEVSKGETKLLSPGRKRGGDGEKGWGGGGGDWDWCSGGGQGSGYHHPEYPAASKDANTNIP